MHDLSVISFRIMNVANKVVRGMFSLFYQIVNEKSRSELPKRLGLILFLSLFLINNLNKIRIVVFKVRRETKSEAINENLH